MPPSRSRPRRSMNRPSKLKAERDRYALRLVATILRKRAASSLAALRETVANRLENLEHEAEEVELRRDHLRSLRKGETISDEDLKQLERDAHRSYLARIRSVGKVLRAIEAEMEDLLDLQGLLAKCPTDTESKAEALLAELEAIHREEPDEKVIIFSEYSATVFWLAGFLGRHGYADRLLTFDGEPVGAGTPEDSGPIPVAGSIASDQHRRGQRGPQPSGAIAVASSITSCRSTPTACSSGKGASIVMARSGPAGSPSFTPKTPTRARCSPGCSPRSRAQIARLGAIGDVLGALQTDRIEQLLSRSPDDLKAAIAAAERSIDEELSRVNDTHTRAVLGDDPLTSGEVERLQTALAAGRSLNVAIGDFVVRAIGLAGGRCRRQDGRIVVAEVPASWVGGRVPASYEALLQRSRRGPFRYALQLDSRRGSSAGPGGDPLGPQAVAMTP